MQGGTLMNEDKMKEKQCILEEKECCAGCRHKATPRTEEASRALQNRLKRIVGQLNGIQKMLDDNRYCGDILTQIAAVESALQSFGYQILEEHLKTCVAEQIRQGNDEILDEATVLIKKLK